MLAQGKAAASIDNIDPACFAIVNTQPVSELLQDIQQSEENDSAWYSFGFKRENMQHPGRNVLLNNFEKKHGKLFLKLSENKKLIAAILAFPVPFGLFGAHRIYLGTKPIVPIMYIATFGGCFFILPFIDFVVVLFEKDLSPYENNPKIFMWVK